MTGTFQGFDLAFGSFGQQYTAIDGQRYVTWFDLADKDLAGLAHGCRVEFSARPAPTLLCHCPRIEENLPSARYAGARQHGAGHRVQPGGPPMTGHLHPKGAILVPNDRPYPDGALSLYPRTGNSRTIASSVSALKRRCV